MLDLVALPPHNPTENLGWYLGNDIAPVARLILHHCLPISMPSTCNTPPWLSPIVEPFRRSGHTVEKIIIVYVYTVYTVYIEYSECSESKSLRRN